MTAGNPIDALERARRLAQAGDLAGAAEHCRAVVQHGTPNFFALFMLGTIESHFGRFEEAERWLGRAVAVNPRSPEALTSHGNVLLELKRPADAADALTKALALQPRNPTALIYRGLGFAALEKHEEALQDFKRALALEPNSPHALHNCANALIALDRHSEARTIVERLLQIAPNHVAAILNRAAILTREQDDAGALAEIERALRIDPGNPDLWYARGNALMRLGRQQDALAEHERAVTARPDRSDYWIGRGNLLLEMGRNEEALESNERAIALKPESVEALVNCANALMGLGRLDEALACVERAIAIRSSYALAHLLRANILLHLGRIGDSLAAYDAALAAKPGYAEAHYNRGSALLLHGRFREGWRDFEHRWRVAGLSFDRPELKAPEWRGEALAGKSLIVFSEQGLGDTIQFARYLPSLLRMGPRLTFLCHPNLIRLFAPFAENVEMIALCDAERRFDFQCALMSLPLRLGTELETVPNDVPYVFAEDERAESWRERIGDQGFKIGIAWQGNPKGKIDYGRSIPLAKFGPLAELPGVRLISLQRNHGLDQLDRLPSGMMVETLGEFDSGEDAFIDTAAIMQNLDLVITSDTATAHLAGALARPVWVALKHVPDWRWMVGRSDSPWYPTMRLFRQPAPGDWNMVFAEMADALRNRVDGGKDE